MYAWCSVLGRIDWQSGHRIDHAPICSSLVSTGRPASYSYAGVKPSTGTSDALRFVRRSSGTAGDGICVLTVGLLVQLIVPVLISVAVQ